MTEKVASFFFSFFASIIIIIIIIIIEFYIIFGYWNVGEQNRTKQLTFDMQWKTAPKLNWSFLLLLFSPAPQSRGQFHKLHGVFKCFFFRIISFNPF